LKQDIMEIRNKGYEKYSPEYYHHLTIYRFFQNEPEEYAIYSQNLRGQTTLALPSLQLLPRFISVDDREIAMYLIASSIDFFLSQMIDCVSDDNKIIRDGIREGSSKREISIYTKNTECPAFLRIDDAFLENQGDAEIIEEMLRLHADEKETDSFLMDLGAEIPARRSSSNFNQALEETKGDVVKILKRYHPTIKGR